jgi:glycosidase
MSPTTPRAVDEVVRDRPPETLAEALASWPVHETYTASPADWRDEVLYFLLPDRFADENVSGPPLDRRDPGTATARVAAARPPGLRWKDWCDSGASRYQGGNLRGLLDRLGYLADLGVTAIWLGPVFRQRVEDNTYHGYGIQNFFDLDPRFGTRAALVELVRAAHERGMRVILDVIFNHTGTNWLYDDNEAGACWEPGFKREGFYPTMRPRSGMGHAIASGDPDHHDDFVLPKDLRAGDHYWRKGSGNLGGGDLFNPLAEHKVCDFCSLRALNAANPATLDILVAVYQYWISLTDCDGFRVDTVKHVDLQTARNWCNAVNEHAELLGKDNFFLLGEIAGGDPAQALYLTVAENLDAALDIGNARLELRAVGQGLQDPRGYFDNFRASWDDQMGSHRNQGNRHVTVLDDHDHVFGEKIRFSANAPSEHQVAAATAIQLFTLGIPCIYYGTEQALRGLPRETAEREWLPTLSADWLLREAMFGPEHPLATGWDGAQGTRDPSLPGFGPEGTAGVHVFDDQHPAYRRIAALARVRARYAAARRGRQYRRPTSVLHGDFDIQGAGELLAWSRILGDEEVLVLVNTHGEQPRGARVALDPRLVGDELIVACDTSALETADRDACGGGADVRLPVVREGGLAFVDVPPLGPSEVMVLVNRFWV